MVLSAGLTLSLLCSEPSRHLPSPSGGIHSPMWHCLWDPHACPPVTPCSGSACCLSLCQCLTTRDPAAYTKAAPSSPPAGPSPSCHTGPTACSLNTFVCSLSPPSLGRKPPEGRDLVLFAAVFTRHRASAGETCWANNQVKMLTGGTWVLGGESKSLTRGQAGLESVRRCHWTGPGELPTQ